ncbi:MAG: hypothetical protein GY898_14280 [Proteobacteria bacterium]|nr:hypothetical protein [Pseudomonadota bacterium]
MLRPLPLILLALAVAGCEFWNPPEPDLNVDGILQCGDVEVLTEYGSGDSLPVEVGTGTGVELRLDLFDGTHSARLAVDSGGGLVRMLEIWDSVSGDRLITATKGSGEELTLELIATNTLLLDGTVSVTCVASGEVCFNLGDDDGDGDADCADISCARAASCVDDQDDFSTAELDCGDTLVPLDVPILSTISDQRTIYATSPGGEEGPAQEFWGGAEIAIHEVEAAGTIEIETQTEALVCPGIPSPEVVLCVEPVRLAAGESVTVSTDELPLWLEPVGPQFDAVSARLNCD